MNNDSAFLQSNALQPPATGSALTVDEVLEAIAVDFHGCALLLLLGWVGGWVAEAARCCRSLTRGHRTLLLLLLLLLLQ